MLSEYNVPPFFPAISHAKRPRHYQGFPEDSAFWLAHNLIDRIKQVMNTPCNTSSAPEFKFELPEEATKQNLAVLAKYDFGLRWALNAQQDSPLGPGKELKPLDIL